MVVPADWVDPRFEELDDLRRAAVGIVKQTPVVSLRSLSDRCGGEVALKAENLQRTGSFKLRGAVSKLSSPEAEGRTGVVAGSAGNHAQSLAYAARARGLACTVFMPERAALSKVAAVQAFGGEVHHHGASVDDCVAAARDLADREGLLFVHPFDDPDIVKGQSGLGLELLEQVPDLAQIVVPVGGGGLISGVAVGVKLRRPDVKVVGVQAAGCAPFPDAIATGRPVTVEQPVTIADGIAVKRPGRLTLDLIMRWVDDLVVVDDDAIADAMLMLAERAKLVCEGAGAAAVAALMSGAVSGTDAGTTVAVLSGGNVDARVLATVIARCETDAGRRSRLFTRVSDHPGGLAELLQSVAAAGANVLEVTHIRDGIPRGVAETGVELVLETRGREHLEALQAAMSAAGYVLEDRSPHP